MLSNVEKSRFAGTRRVPPLANLARIVMSALGSGARFQGNCERVRSRFASGRSRCERVLPRNLHRSGPSDRLPSVTASDPTATFGAGRSGSGLGDEAAIAPRSVEIGRAHV